MLVQEEMPGTTLQCTWSVSSPIGRNDCIRRGSEAQAHRATAHRAPVHRAKMRRVRSDAKSPSCEEPQIWLKPALTASGEIKTPPLHMLNRASGYSIR